jgi:hypothetical protein
MNEGLGVVGGEVRVQVWRLARWWKGAEVYGGFWG